MAKPFKDLVDKMPEEYQIGAKVQAEDMLLEMALQELRQTLGLTQQQLADALGISQAALSKMEQQKDMHIGTLRRLLLAMGAELKIVASFPEGDVVIREPKKTPYVSV